MNIFTKLGIATTALTISTASFAGISAEVGIAAIQVQDNRTWIDLTDSIGSATTCSNKTAVELANDGNVNRELIISVALTALTAGRKVVIIASNDCSNVDKDIIKGIRIVRTKSE